MVRGRERNEFFGLIAGIQDGRACPHQVENVVGGSITSEMRSLSPAAGLGSLLPSLQMLVD